MNKANPSRREKWNVISNDANFEKYRKGKAVLEKLKRH